MSEHMINDPHAAKILPDDPRLKIQQNKGRALKKGHVQFLVIAVFLVVIAAFIMALFRSSERIEKTQDAKKTKREEVQIQRTDVIPPEVNRLENLEITLPDKPQNNANKKTDKSLKDNDKSQRRNRQTDEEQMRLDEERAAMNAGLEAGGGSGYDSFRMGRDKPSDPKQELVDRYSKALEQVQSGANGASNPFDGMALAGMGDTDQNMQGRKNQFLQRNDLSDDYVTGRLNEPISRYEVKASTIIPVSLITGISSDLPGEIVGQVRENVYDTVSGNHLLIPQGTRVMAKYDSMIAYGQERVLVCWDRLIRPDGTSIRLECAPGTDLAGYAGFEDEVDHHYGRLMGGVILSSLLSVGASTSQGTSLGDNTDMQEVFALNVGQNINNVGQQITRRNLAIQPTITIRPGYSVNILVNKDMVLTPYKVD